MKTCGSRRLSPGATLLGRVTAHHQGGGRLEWHPHGWAEAPCLTHPSPKEKSDLTEQSQGVSVSLKTVKRVLLLLIVYLCTGGLL